MTGTREHLVAVVTGGHSYDVPGFHALFRRMEGVEPVIQHMDDFASSSEKVRDDYDAVLFYTMLREGPSDEGQPWYSGKPRTALARLGQTTQGIFILHHALLAYLSWPVWGEVVGMKDRKSGFHAGQRLRVRVSDPDHPITRGLHDWEMEDETYTIGEPDEGNEVLLTTDHPNSMKALGWTRQFGKSRVFCLQSGHDATVWGDATYQEVVRRGILWSAGRI